AGNSAGPCGSAAVGSLLIANSDAVGIEAVTGISLIGGNSPAAISQARAAGSLANLVGFTSRASTANPSEPIPHAQRLPCATCGLHAAANEVFWVTNTHSISGHKIPAWH